ncbi:aminotransferase class III-fold pyridoxal phosphate-dependent enzyme, partial [Oceanithermus sp.]
PHPYRPPFGAKPEDAGQVVLDYIAHLFKTKLPPDEVGAIFFEPIQGEGGYVVPPQGFLPALQELARRHGILLVADEVQTGSGRTGRFLASAYEGLDPDIVILAKGLASGYPISAVLFKEELSSWPPGAHGSTFGGNPVAAAAATATLDLLEEGLMQNAYEVGAFLREELAKLQADFPRLGDVRGRGLMIGLDFVKDPGTREEDPELRDRVAEAAFAKGLLTLPAGPSTLRLSPPLVLSRAEAALAVELLGEVLRELA